MINELIRPQTEAEKNMTATSQDGDTTGFVDISKNTHTDYRVCAEIFHKFALRNRKIIASSLNPLLEIKKLSCRGCFRKEHQSGLVSDDLNENFERYKGRMILGEIKFDNRPNRLKTFSETGITLMFKPCEYCFKRESFGFLQEELKPEAFELLRKTAIKNDLELAEAELN